MSDLRVLMLSYYCLLATVVQCDYIIREDGYCVLHEQCGYNPALDDEVHRGGIPCVQNVPAIELNEFGTMYAKLQNLCPYLINPNGPTKVCCQNDQLNTLASQISAIDVLYMSCPNCVQNMHNLFCQISCSPHQSLFLNVTKSAKQDKFQYESAIAYTVYNTQEFAEAVFDSCKDVMFPPCNDKAIALSCNGYSAEDCTAQEWLNFIGSTNNGIASTNITYQLVVNGSTNNSEAIQFSELPDERIIPNSAPTTPCNISPTANESACQCTDCRMSCQSTAPTPSESNLNTRDATILIIMFSTFMAFVGVYIWEKAKSNAQRRELGD